jgi:predicted N-formylglutamate amidohydrolase
MDKPPAPLPLATPASTTAPPRPRIAAATAETWTVLPGLADAGLIILCDHASNAFPPGYGTLGLAAAQLQRHIAYDIGAAAITRQLAALLGVPAVLTHYSRLLIDPNRGADDPTLIMRLSDGAVVPGNRNLTAAERDTRIERYYRPYHDTVAEVVQRCVATGIRPAILSIHSFTESWKTVPRPWHAGILWDRDPRLALPLLEALFAEGDLIVGDNQPYHGGLEGDTMWTHGTCNGLAHCIIEVRQDLIRDEAGQTAWSHRLSRLMRSLLDRPDLQLAFRSATPGQSGDQSGDQHGIHSTKAPPTTTPTEITMTDKPAQENPIQTTAMGDIELEAAAYRRLVAHLRTRSDVQNIDLMNLAGFCRNCLSNWYQEAASAKGVSISKDQARELVYGMPYKDWQAQHQVAASPAQQAKFTAAKPHDH